MAAVLEKLVCEELVVHGLIQWLSASSDDVSLVTFRLWLRVRYRIFR